MCRCGGGTASLVSPSLRTDVTATPLCGAPRVALAPENGAGPSRLGRTPRATLLGVAPRCDDACDPAHGACAAGAETGSDAGVGGTHAQSSTRHPTTLGAPGLRAAPTLSEQRLWTRLSAKQLGVAFRRQVVTGQYIVDFVALREKLIVEVDGSAHIGRESRDERRDRVLRLDAELVMKDLDLAVAMVRAALAAE